MRGAFGRVRLTIAGLRIDPAPSSPAVPPLSPALRLARWATRVLFLCLGFVMGAWGVHVPSAKLHYGLSEGGLAVALLSVAGGAVLCLLVAGRLVERWGARAAAVAGGVVMCATLAGVLWPASVVLLLALLLAFGASSALFDVAINTEGAELEARSGRKVMSGFHGMFSLGGMSGAAVGALLLKLQVAPALQLAAVCVATAAALLAAARHMLPVAAHRGGGAEGERAPQGAEAAAAAGVAPAAALPAGAARRTLNLLGGLAVVGMLAEGSMYDWSVLYLKQALGAPQSLAALGYASFSAAMAAARFGGDWLRERVPAGRLMRASALGAAASMALALAAAEPWVAIVGYAGVGIGLANVVPMLYLASARVPGVAPARGLAHVSALGYLGFVAGPPVVGGIAEVASLSWGMAVVVAAGLVLAAGARGR